MDAVARAVGVVGSAESGPERFIGDMKIARKARRRDSSSCQKRNRHIVLGDRVSGTVLCVCVWCICTF